jgi:hypothetical protein
MPLYRSLFTIHNYPPILRYVTHVDVKVINQTT